MNRAAILATLAAVAFSPEAGAQPFPFKLPFFEEGDKKKSKDKDQDDGQKKDEPEEEPPLPRVYTRPAAKTLPDGPARDLSGPIALVPFDAIVNPGMGEFTVDSIRRAEHEGAQALLIELDTPGGQVTTTQTMVKAILGAKIPVIVFVSPSGAHAASAGTFITMAGHVAAMAPATRIGAAHPVLGGGEDPEEAGGKHMGRKVENDLAALAEGIAAERGRNVEWAIDAVRHSVSIIAAKAEEIGVIDLVAEGRGDLFEKLEGRELLVDGKKVRLHTKDATVTTYEPTIRQRVLNFLADPGIAILLGVLGMIGILMEIYHPGVIAPGVMGVICILLALIGAEQLPIDAGAALLILAGIGLLIAELFTATYGVLGLLGAIGLTVGLLLVVDLSDPDFAVDRSLRLELKDVLPVVALFVVAVSYVSLFVVRSQRRPPVTGSEALVGSLGSVLRPVDANGGMVLVQGEYWKARSTEPIATDEQVEVTGVNGLELEVRRKQKGT